MLDRPAIERYVSGIRISGNTRKKKNDTSNSARNASAWNSSTEKTMSPTNAVRTPITPKTT
jgi:hypothetical protein